MSNIMLHEDGRLSGYAVLWDEDLGLPNIPIYPPKNHTNYPYFKGICTYGKEFAPLSWVGAETILYYHKCEIGATVSVEDDEYGIWVSGSTTPGCKIEDYRPDWRNIKGRLELVALHYPGDV